MNISETGDSYLPSNILATAPATRTSRGTAAREAQVASTAVPMDAYAPEPISETGDGDGQDTRAARDTGDTYIPSPRVMRNALYNVSDVKTDASGRVVRTAEPVSVQLTGMGGSDKIADIMLSMGRKLLSIFRVTG